MTGAAGFIGGRMAADLSTSEFDIVGFIRTPPTATLSSLGIKTVCGDIAEGLDQVPPAEWIIHTAAVTHLDPTLTATAYARANILGALNVAAYARRVRAKGLLFLSTLTVYGKVTTNHLSEDEEPSAPNLYGRSKRLAEEILLELAPETTVICARLPGVAAPAYLRPWLGQVISKLRSNAPVEFYNGDRPFNNIIHVAELSRFARHLIMNEGGSARATGQVVNVAADNPIPLGELMEIMREAAGSESPLVNRGPRPPCFEIDIARLKTRCGFSPKGTEELARRYVLENSRAATDDAT